MALPVENATYTKAKKLLDSFDKPSTFPGGYQGYDLLRVFIESGNAYECDKASIVLSVPHYGNFVRMFRDFFHIKQCGFGEGSDFQRLIVEAKSTEPHKGYLNTPEIGYHGRPLDEADYKATDKVYGFDINFKIVLTTLTKINKTWELTHKPGTLLKFVNGWYVETQGSGDRWYPYLEQAICARNIAVDHNDTMMKSLTEEIEK